MSENGFQICGGWGMQELQHLRPFEFVVFNTTLHASRITRHSSLITREPARQASVVSNEELAVGLDSCLCEWFVCLDRRLAGVSEPSILSHVRSAPCRIPRAHHGVHNSYRTRTVWHGTQRTGIFPCPYVPFHL